MKILAHVSQLISKTDQVIAVIKPQTTSISMVKKKILLNSASTYTINKHVAPLNKTEGNETKKQLVTF